MLDITFVREHPTLVKESEQRRHHDFSVVDTVLKLDEEWRKALKTREEFNRKRNVVSEEINKAKKENKNTVADQKITEMRTIVSTI